MTTLYKVHVFVPKTHADAVRISIGETGADKIGNYDYCSFVSEGHGYFRPLDGANPSIGQIGEIEKVPEVKIEFICEGSKIKAVLEAVKKVHPYEEVLLDILPIIDPKDVK